MLHLQTLGALRLDGPEGPVLPGRRKELALLAFLARRAPRPVARAELAALIWGDRDEARARHSLRQALVQLKRVLDDALDVGTEHVAVGGAVELDVAAFERELAAGRHAEGVALWKGEFLASAEDAGGEDYRLWVEAERVALRAKLSRALEWLASRAEERGDWSGAVVWAERWVEALPLDEAAELRLLQTLRLDGRLEEAQARYAAFALRLREELGREPAPELRRLGGQLDRTARGGTRAARTPGSAALFTPELVGRGAAFAELVAAWEAVRQGAHVVVLVEGEEGIGKTRLCEEFLRWLVSREGEQPCVLRERASAGGAEESWNVARALLAPLADAPGLAGAPPEALAALSSLVPAVRATFPTLPPASGDERELLDAAASVVLDVASETPVVLFVDDLPRADAPSQRLVLAIARRLASDNAQSGAGSGGVMLLVSARPGDADAAGVLAELRSARATRRLKLQPLRRPEVETLISSMLPLPAEARSELARRLHQETGGNPFYVTELVAELVDEGHLVPGESGGWGMTTEWLLHPLPLPKDVREAIGRRLARLTGPARELLAATASRGGRIDADALAAAGFPDAALDEVVARRLLREIEAGSGRYEFTHDLVRRVAGELPTVPALAAQRGGAEPAPAAAPGASEPGAYAPGARLPPRGARRALALGVAGVVLVAVVGLASHAASHPARARRSIAVLPFAHASAEPGNEYFTAGLADELTNALSAVPGLRVAARTSVAALEDRNLDAREIGKRLGADALLEGSVHTAGGRARIVVQLVDPESGYDLWSGRYDRDMRDVLAVQDEIARTIVGALRLQLAPADLQAAPRREDPRAHDLYLRARYLFALRGEANFRKAIAYFQQAIALDSSNPRAWAGLASAQIALAYRAVESRDMYLGAKASAEHAIELDSTVGEAHGALGRVYLYTWDWPGAERELRRAVELSPNDADLRHSYTHALMILRRTDEASLQQARMLELDPFGPQTSFHPCWQYYELRQYDRALQACLAALELHPDQPEAHTKLGFVYYATGQYDAAVTAFTREQEITPGVTSNAANLAMALAAAGRTEEARAELGALERYTPPQLIPPLDVACAQLALREPDRALATLEASAAGRRRDVGYAMGHRDLVYIRYEPCLDPLRTSPRFAAVVRGLGLP